jgi:micrococcal nuclease
MQDSQRYPVTIKSVYDGDTVTADIQVGFGIVLVDQKLRLACINAPEVRGLEREEGLASRDALRAELAKHERLVIYSPYDDGEFRQCKYGRWVAVIASVRGSPSLNRWMIANGFACAKTYDERIERDAI